MITFNVRVDERTTVPVLETIVDKVFSFGSCLFAVFAVAASFFFFRRSKGAVVGKLNRKLVKIQISINFCKSYKLYSD